MDFPDEVDQELTRLRTRVKQLETVAEDARDYVRAVDTVVDVLACKYALRENLAKAGYFL